MSKNYQQYEEYQFTETPSVRSCLEEEFDVDDMTVVVEDYLTSLSTLKKLGHTLYEYDFKDTEEAPKITPRVGKGSDEAGILLPKTFGNLSPEPFQEPKLTENSPEDIQGS